MRNIKDLSKLRDLFTNGNDNLFCIATNEPDKILDYLDYVDVDSWTEFKKDCTSSVLDVNPELSFTVYPIPADEVVIIEREESSECHINLYDLSGQTYLEETYPMGMDIIELITEDILYRVC